MTDNLKPYSIDYRHAGQTWGVIIHAKDIDDARAKVRSIGANGEPFEVIAHFESAVPPSIMLLPLSVAVWVMNLWVRAKRALSGGRR